MFKYLITLLLLSATTLTLLSCDAHTVTPTDPGVSAASPVITSTESSPGSSPIFNSPSQEISISWIDFIKFNNITYVGTISQTGSVPVGNLSAADRIQFKVADVVTDPGYKIKNGDAAFLEIGTPIYSIQGYSPEFRLVAFREQQPVIFEADTNLNAKRGADLLDIGGKVTSISINSHVDGKTELASIKDEKQVSGLIQMILDAPVNQTVRRHGSEQYFLDFYLQDNTVVHRSYWLDTGELSRGIYLPEEFGQAIRSALLMQDASQSTDELDGSHWKLISINGNQLVPGSYISLYFSKGTIWGSAGLNTYDGSYLVNSPGTLTLSDAIRTLIGGPENIIQQEEAYIKYFQSAVSYRFNDNHLEISSADNPQPLVFERLPEYPMNPADLVNTKWKLITLNDEAVADDLSATLVFETGGKATGQAGSFVTRLEYKASGDTIHVLGATGENLMDIQLPLALENQAGHYTSSITFASCYYLTQDRLEIFTDRGETLVFEPLNTAK